MSLVRTSTTQRPGKHRAEVPHHGRRAAATVALAAGLAAGPALTSPASAADYTVKSGDTLSSIAQSMGTSWQNLYAANRDVVSSPTMIYPGQTLRIPVPPLTEERRKDLVKLAGKYAEQQKISVRNVRRDANDDLKKAEKAGEMSQDEQKKMETEVQKDTDAAIKRIDEALKTKEAEIMQV